VMVILRSSVLWSNMGGRGGGGFVVFVGVFEGFFFLSSFLGLFGFLDSSFFLG